MDRVTQEVRRQLIGKLDTLYARAGRIEAHQKNTHHAVPLDSQEAAAFRSNDMVVDALDDHTREEIARIQATLARIDGGTWGMCMSCDEPIREGRLRALPTAVLCVHCAARAEEARRRA